MRIISKFHDYYDTAASYGIDTSIIYKREIQEIEREQFFKQFGFNDLKKDFWGLRSELHDRSHVYPFFILFCGSCYLGLEIVNRDTFKSTFLHGNSIESEIERQEVYHKYGSAKHQGYYITFSRVDCKILRGYEEFFTSKASQIHSEYDSPILSFHLGKGKVCINSELKKFEFFKMKDSHTAHQEIMQYLSGVLGNREKDLIEISDKNRLLSHGFDNKWSFRNPDPPTRKAKKK